MTFRKGNHNLHDVAAAGRKGKAASPWNRGMLFTPNARRAKAEFERRNKEKASSKGTQHD